MTALETFQFPATGQQIRVLSGDEPVWVATDICAVLGHTNPTMAVAGLDDDERGLRIVETPSGQRLQMIVVTEPGLYSLILRSRKPEAKAFKRWVTHDVLPVIRKTGRYEVAALSPRQLAELVIAEADRADRAEGRLAIAAPKAEAWDTLASAHGDYSVREAAYILNRDPSIDTGQKRLFQLLRDWKLIDRRDIPYADHARHVRLRARSYTSPRSGEERTSEQVRITAEGLRYLHRRMGGTSPLAAGPLDSPAGPRETRPSDPPGRPGLTA